jgi:hypothetical protein
MAAADPLSEKMKNDTEVTADLAIFVAVTSYGPSGEAAHPEIVHHQGWRNAQKHG